MADIERILYGDVRANAKGMVTQMTELKSLVETLTLRDRERILTMRGIAIGLGLTTVLSGSTLIAVVSSLQQIVAALSALP